METDKKGVEEFYENIKVGINEESWTPYFKEYSDSDILDHFMKIFASGKPMFTDSDSPIGETYPGSGAYRLPGGGLTGKGGWEYFTKLLKETNAN